MCRKALCCGCLRRCTWFTILAVATAGALLLCAWLSSLVVRFTPLFKKVECEPQVDWELDHSTGLLVIMRCANFSPIAFEIEEGEPGPAWIDNIGSEEKPDVYAVPVQSILQAHGLGDIMVRLNFIPESIERHSHNLMNSRDGWMIYMRFDRKMYLHIPGALFFLSSYEVVETQWCGVKFPSSWNIERGREPGALKCTRSREELQDAKFNFADAQEDVVITAAELHVDEVEIKKDIILGVAISLAYTVALGLLGCAFSMAFKAGNVVGRDEVKLRQAEKEEEKEEIWQNHVTTI